MSIDNFSDTVEFEFRDLLYNIAHGERKKYHMYTIHRLMSLGLLNDYRFSYEKVGNDRNKIAIKIDLKSSGVVTFLLDMETGYASIASKDSLNNINFYLHNFDYRVGNLNQDDKLF